MKRRTFVVVALPFLYLLKFNAEVSCIHNRVMSFKRPSNGDTKQGGKNENSVAFAVIFTV